MSGLGARDRRAVLAGALVLAGVVALRLGVLPLLGHWRQAGDRVASEAQLWAREVAILAEARSFSGRLDTLEAAVADAGRMLFGGEPAIAVADLIAYAAALADSSGVHLLAAQPRVSPDSAANGVREVAVEIAAHSDFEGVLRFLHALETGPKLVRVHRLALESAEGATYQPAGGVQVLTFRATLAGYVAAKAEDG